MLELSRNTGYGEAIGRKRGTATWKKTKRKGGGRRR
jgi:hypothetical protein